jgi:hypothetical protein
MNNLRSLGQKKRWAKYHAAKTTAAVAPQTTIVKKRKARKRRTSNSIGMHATAFSLGGNASIVSTSVNPRTGKPNGWIVRDGNFVMKKQGVGNWVNHPDTLNHSNPLHKEVSFRTPRVAFTTYNKNKK